MSDQPGAAQVLTERERFEAWVKAAHIGIETMTEYNMWSGWQARATLPESPTPIPWRCFHCDETFADSDAARDHFGHSEYSQPACHIDAAKYREMEERVSRANADDSDTDRRMYSMQGDHTMALIREEEKGYARGLRDAQKHPADLGLQPIPAAAGGDVPVAREIPATLQMLDVTAFRLKARIDRAVELGLPSVSMGSSFAADIEHALSTAHDWINGTGPYAEPPGQDTGEAT